MEKSGQNSIESNIDRDQDNFEIYDSNNKDGADKPKKDPKLFEVPEFLYKFSSTFFKKASNKDRKIFKMFGKENTEKARIRTDRIGKGAIKFGLEVLEEGKREFQSEIRVRRGMDSENNFETSDNFRNFKRKDLSSRNIKLNAEGQIEEDDVEEEKKMDLESQPNSIKDGSLKKSARFGHVRYVQQIYFNNYLNFDIFQIVQSCRPQQQKYLKSIKRSFG